MSYILFSSKFVMSKSKSMKVKFYLSRPEAKTESSVIISVSYSKQRFKLPAGESINPKFWNAKKHEARQMIEEALKVKPDVKDIEELLNIVYKQRSHKS